MSLFSFPFLNLSFSYYCPNVNIQPSSTLNPLLTPFQDCVRIHVVLSHPSTVAPIGTQPSLASSHLWDVCSIASFMELKLKVFESKRMLIPYPVWPPWCSKHHLCLLSLLILKISPVPCRRCPSLLSLVLKVPLGIYSNLLSQLYFFVIPCDLFHGCFTVVLWTKALRKKCGFNLRFKHEHENLCVRVRMCECAYQIAWYVLALLLKK